MQRVPHLTVAGTNNHWVDEMLKHSYTGSGIALFRITITVVVVVVVAF